MPAGGLPADGTNSSKFWSVQNMLLILGAVMLAGASIVFLIFSWGQMELGLRAIIIGAFTAILFASAWLTTRRGLRASGEAISGLAALMLYLDGWALRATELITWESGSNYFAALNIVTGAILVSVGLALRLLTPRVIGTALIPLGALALAAGQGSALSATLVLCAGTLVGLVVFHPSADRITRTALTISSSILIAGTPFTVLAALIVDGLGAGAIALASVTVVCGSFAWLFPQLSPGLSILTSVCAVTSGLLMGAWASSARQTGHSVPTLEVLALPMLGALIASVIVVALVSAKPRRAGLGLAPIAVPTALILTTVFAVPVLLLLAGLATVESISGPDRTGLESKHAFVATAFFALAMLALWARGVQRALTQQVAAWSSMLVVLALPTLVHAPLLRFSLWITLGVAAALVSAVVRTRGPARMPVRILAGAAFFPALTVVFAVSVAAWEPAISASTGTHLLGILLLTLAGVLFSVRSWDILSSAPPSSRSLPLTAQAFLLAGSVLSAVWGAAVLVESLTSTRFSGLLIVGLALLTLSAALLLNVVMSAAAPTRDVQSVLTCSFLITVLALPVLAFDPFLLGPQWLKVVAVTFALITLVHPVILTFLSRKATGSTDSLGIYVACLVPACVLLLIRVTSSLDPSHSIEWPLVAIGLLSVLPVIAGLTIQRLPARRVGLEYATLIALILMTLLIIGDATRAGFGFLLMSAGSFALSTTQARREFVWVGYALAIVSSWTLSVAKGLDFIEVYTVPVGVLIAALGQASLRRGRSHTLLLVGLATLVIPTAIQSWQGDTWRGIATVTASLACAVAAGMLRTRSDRGAQHPALWPLARDVGLLGLAVTVFGPWARALNRIPHDDVASVLLWTLLAAVLAALNCWALDAPRRWTQTPGPRIWGPLLVATILTVPSTCLALTNRLSPQAATVTVLLLIVGWGALSILGTPPGWPRIHSNSQFASRAGLPLIIGFALAWLTRNSTSVPWDVLLTIAGGFIAFVTFRAAQILLDRSTWQNVSLGVIASVAPFSFAMLNEPTGWRITLAVLLASGWLLAGLRLRWQAPVILGACALLAHVAVLAGPPALAAFGGLEGWVVLALVGAVLLSVGLLYERQVARAKSAIRRFTDLR